MSQTKEILRLLWAQEQSVRAVSRALGVSSGVVSKVSSRAKRLELDWAKVSDLSEEELYKQLYGQGARLGSARPEPVPEEMHTALMGAGVTLELLHQEYLEEHPTGLKYSAFASRYREWKKKQRVTMRQPHQGGDKLFIDYSGKKPHIIDAKTGNKVECELFVATLGASNLTFATATLTQQVPDFIRANTLALEYFGGVPKMVVPDRLKSAVVDADPYEPTVQRTFADFSRHYGTAIVPARSYKPRDKAKVEVSVQVVQRWILARLRHETFFTLSELNKRIAELLEELNARPMKKLGAITRRALFEKIEQSALMPLPQRRFEPCEWKKVRVNTDYHVAISDHYYSAPFTMAHEVLEARVTARTVELFYRGKRVASHALSDKKYAHTTDVAHMPDNHKEWAERDPSKLLEWARQNGPHTEALMTRIIERSPIAIQGWRSGRGLRRVGEKYGMERTEEACRRALRFGAQSYKPVERMLRLELDQRPLPDETEDESPIHHAQVRGPDYYTH